MPRVKFDYIASFSSEDSEHKASNLLNWEVSKKRWLCAAGEPSCSVVIQLKAVVQITSVNIGVYHSALVEVLVGRSEQPNEPFQVLVPSCIFVNPRESRGEAVERVRSFSREQLCDVTRDQRWDRVRVVCSQPYNKHCKYGLSFIHLDSSDETSSTTTAAPSSIPARLLSIPRYSSDEEEFTPGELFKLRRSSQDPTGSSEGSSDAQIRQASSQALRNISDSATKLVKTPISKNSKTSSKTDVDPNRNRQSEKLMYKDDDDEPHAKIDRVVQRHKDEKSRDEAKKSKEKETSDAKKDKTQSEKLNNSKNKFEDFLNGKKDDKRKKGENERRSENNHITSKREQYSSRKDEVPTTSRSVTHTETSHRKRKHSGKKQNNNPSPYTIMSGVVFAMSGYENPRRGKLRDAALSMGARYSPQWGNDCTHLICAFPNTPKLKSIRSERSCKCIAVKAEWIEACSEVGILLPWTWFATEHKYKVTPPADWKEKALEGKRKNESDVDTVSECDTDDEIEKVLRKQESDKKKQKRDDDVTAPVTSDKMAARDVTDRVDRMTEGEVSNASRDSDVAFVRDERIQGNITLQEDDSDATEPESRLDPDDVTVDESAVLPDLFSGARFLVPNDDENVARYVIAYGGLVVQLEELLDDEPKVDYIISEDVPDSNVRGVCVRADWLWKCHRKRKLCSTDTFEVQ